MNIITFKDNKKRAMYIFLLSITFLDYLIFREKYLLFQLIEFGFWLWYFLKSKAEDIIVIKTAIIFLLISLFFYIISQTELSEHFINAGIVFILLSVIVGFIEQVKDEKK